LTSPFWRIILDISDRFWREIEKGAKRRGIYFNLTREAAWKIFLAQDEKCYYTGFPLEFISKGYRGIASLDRLNSAIGYVENNCCWTLAPINTMKHKFSKIYFIKLCCLVAEHNNILSSQH
jgi:hypothetical protein